MIAVLMAVKNGEEFMQESVASVLAQTYPHWTLLVGINGLPPNSPAWQKARAYAQQYPDQIWAYELPPDEAVDKPTALNCMMSLIPPATEYVAILDVDDIWHPTKLEKQVPYMGTYDVIGTHCIYFGDPAFAGIVPQIPLHDFTRTHNFATLNPVINSSCLIRAPLAEWDPTAPRGVEDYVLWKKLWARGCTFYNLPEILVKHRIHARSAFNAVHRGASATYIV